MTNEVFMEIVRQFPILYDRFSIDFKDKHKKNNAWAKVAETTGFPVEECIKKYKNIRTNYVRNCKKRKPPGSGRTSDESDHSHSFRWLDTFSEHRPTVNNLPFQLPLETISPTSSNLSNDPEVVDDEDEDEDQHANPFENASNLSVSPAPESTGGSSSVDDEQEGLKRSRQGENDSNTRPWAKGAKKVKKSDVDNKFFKTIDNFEKTFSSRVNALNEKSCEDEDLLFCKSIAAQIRRLPLEKKGLAKCQILQMLQSIEFGDRKSVV